MPYVGEVPGDKPGQFVMAGFSGHDEVFSAEASKLAQGWWMQGPPVFLDILTNPPIYPSVQLGVVGFFFFFFFYFLLAFSQFGQLLLDWMTLGWVLRQWQCDGLPCPKPFQRHSVHHILQLGTSHMVALGHIRASCYMALKPCPFNICKWPFDGDQDAYGSADGILVSGNELLVSGHEPELPVSGSCRRF